MLQLPCLTYLSFMNKACIIQAGAVKYLVGLMDPATEMVDKAVTLLANLSTITEGCSAIARERGIPLLVEIVETGSQRGNGNAASILLHLCINIPNMVLSVLREGAVPPLVALSQSGTPRAKEKARQLLCHFRNMFAVMCSRSRLFSLYSSTIGVCCPLRFWLVVALFLYLFMQVVHTWFVNMLKLFYDACVTFHGISLWCTVV